MRVITFGVFDYFHFGHLRLFERCKEYGDYLIVAVQDGNEIHKTKPGVDIMYTTEQRVKLLEALKCIDKVVVYKQVEDDIKKIDFDTFIVGEDQTHSGFKKAVEYCESSGKNVIRLTRTPGISSTLIRTKREN